MKRENNTWFGFSLTQKQSVNIFILSLIGVIFSSFALFMMTYQMFISFSYYDPYYYSENYVLQMFLSMLGPLMLLLIIFLLSLYSMIRTRKIAKFYSPSIHPEFGGKPIPHHTPLARNEIVQYCPNCGNIRKADQKFCMNCGYQIS